MANLKFDLLNRLKSDKYYEELELVRLASDPNMNYRDKIDNMVLSLEKIVVVNAQMGLVEQYFQDAPQEKQPSQQQQTIPETPNKHQGQTHGE